MANNKNDSSQFGFFRSRSGNARQCSDCEAMLTDALDGTLSDAEQAALDLHLIGCAACSSMFADAQRGAAWLELLKSPRPEPPAALVDRILAQTSAQTSAQASENKARPRLVSNTLLGLPALPAAGVSPRASNVLPFRSRIAAGFNLHAIGQTLLQPRLAMTAAMAFFSVALTLNLTGVHLSQLHASDLRPSSIKRSIADANAHVVRYYDNLSVVYELESRVNDLQHSSDTNADLPASAPATKPAVNQPSDQPGQPNQQPAQQPGQPNQQKPAEPKKPHGISRYDAPNGNLHFVAAQSLPRQSLAAGEPPAFGAVSALRRSSYPRNFSRPMQEGSLV